MNQKTRQILNTINRDFYSVTAQEFDQTRGRAWAGWEQLLTVADLPIKSVLDVGCGNGRFGIFLAENQVEPLHYHGVDNSETLLKFAGEALKAYPSLRVDLSQKDVILGELPEGEFDLVVLFGVIHHVPGFEQRQQFMRDLAGRVAMDGMLAFAEWRFYEQERFRQRIVAWDAGIEVERHDYLLDWRRGERALRYCHYVDDAEHEQLVTATGLRVVADYRADGSTGDLNRYCVLSNELKGKS